MTSVPQELVELVRQAAPPAAEVIPLSWNYEDEDYTVAVVIPDAVDRVETRQLQDRLIEVVMDYDDAHDTFTVCMVWHEREKTHVGLL
ncbi:MAG: hypothetical protein OEU26_09910 [Candidatus Tectomicrobia bacterium]|nr:hypothetical protein [Candidatus Tectomicrobia bacterium]